MAKVIAFSGGCHSGKTTTINKVAEALEARGHKVIKLSELMREVTKIPIDELRKDPHKYLEVQEQIISAKINQECNAFNDTSRAIYLVDRAISDSIFYLENYIDKSSLNTTEIIRLCNLNFVARQHAMDAFNRGYDMLLEFEPLDIIDDSDKYRPHELEYLKDYEYQGISTINKALLWCRCDNYAALYNFFFEVNVQCNSIDYIVDVITDSLGI